MTKATAAKPPRKQAPRLITEGTLTVGTDTPFPPFEIGQPPNISGYDIEIMNAVAENLGLTA